VTTVTTSTDPNERNPAASDGIGSDELGRAEPSDAERSFERWLTSLGASDAGPIVGLVDPQQALTGMLGELIRSGRPLTSGAAVQLGLPVGTTQGHAATELLLAVNDPDGPNCRSYRSALYFLRDRDDTRVDP